MQVQINLKNPPTSPTVNVNLQWGIRVGTPKSGLLAKLFRKFNRVEKEVFLTIPEETIDVSPDIVCDKSQLFSILYGEERFTQEQFPVNMSLSEMATSFQLLFNQGEIKDCSRQQDTEPRVCPIKYKINLESEEGELIDSIDEQIDVIFEPLNVKPRVNLIFNEDEIPYSSTLKNEKIGFFTAYVEEGFRFTPRYLVHISVKLYQGQRELQEAIALDSAGHTEADIEIEGGSQNAQHLPLYVDFSKIHNPATAREDYTVEYTIVQSAYYSPEIKETNLYQSHFALIKDDQGTELKVQMSLNGDGEAVACDNHSQPQQKEMSFTPQSGMRGVVSFKLSNIATDNSNERSGLYIKNLTLTEELEEGVTVVDSDNLPLTHFVELNGRDIEEMSSGDGLFIPNGPMAETHIDLSFDPSKIVDVYNSLNYDFQVKTTLCFDYWEDRDGKGILRSEEKKQCRLPLLWKLNLKPNPEWLCVDYGSSAIVCCYDEKVINLKSRKDIIFRNLLDGRYKDDKIETSTPFLASDIVLHPIAKPKNSTLCSQQSVDAQTPYLDLSVCLSPTSSLIVDDVLTQLPCLKILVGNEFLPENKNYSEFMYARRTDDKGGWRQVKASEAKKQGEASYLLRIESIFNEAYSALFRYFIFPEIRDKQRDRSINKLVLTYPNTYTPVHLRTLEKIAKKTFPKVHDGYLRFVSESDAVAAYYVQNWNHFNDRNSARRIGDDETVLVYDMGAGTLDVTLFKKSQGEDGKIEVEILGKIGTGKAGNYLDYVICEIIADHVEGAITSADAVVSTISPGDVSILRSRLELKRAVKDDIKPLLLPHEKLTYNHKTFSSEVILNDERFKTYLSDVTVGILGQLLEHVGTDLSINTVLMSGRGCRLTSLQNALEKALEERNGSKAKSKVKIIKFGIKGGKNKDQEKTVVAEGAMITANLFSSPESPVRIHSRRLYASYGVVYQQLGGIYKYVELINSTDVPSVKDISKLDDYDGPSINIKGTGAAPTIKLVQTYLSQSDTEAAYDKGDFEFISEMEEFNMADFDHKDQLNVHLKLDYRNNVSLYVNGLVSKGSAPKGVDLNSEITRRSVWPVTI